MIHHNLNERLLLSPDDLADTHPVVLIILSNEVGELEVTSSGRTALAASGKLHQQRVLRKLRTVEEEFLLIHTDAMRSEETTNNKVIEKEATDGDSHRVVVFLDDSDEDNNSSCNVVDEHENCLLHEEDILKEEPSADVTDYSNTATCVIVEEPDLSSDVSSLDEPDSSNSNTIPTVTPYGVLDLVREGGSSELSFSDEDIKYLLTRLIPISENWWGASEDDVDTHKSANAANFLPFQTVSM